MEYIKAVKGTYDILPPETELWALIENIVRETMNSYCYEEIRTPVFEDTALFARSIGEDTDIVNKEMYSFKDLGGRNLTLRPEATAGVARSFIENSLDQRGLPCKLWYMGPMFRQERPQKGRQRQFHQFGVEVIGSGSPLADAEVMAVFDRIAFKLGLKNRTFSINSIGGPESRESYRTALVNFLDSMESDMCEDCRRRKTVNPLRVLDCKVPGCREAIHSSPDVPHTLDYLTDSDSSDFKMVMGALDELKIDYIIDNYLVRGLDYYTGTVFEMNCSDLGAQSAVMGGGRYDDLIGQLGGKKQPSVGFACGMERLVILLKSLEKGEKKPEGIFIIYPLAEMGATALKYAEKLREYGYKVELNLVDRSLKAQMKAASRMNAAWVLIVEQEEGTVTARDMSESLQTTVKFDKFVKMLEHNDTAQ